MTSPDALQRKSIKELHPSLALPLVANASLAFLKRHLALTAPQQALINESLEANSRRLVAAERALDAAAGSKVGLPDVCLLVFVPLETFQCVFRLLLAIECMLL